MDSLWKIWMMEHISFAKFGLVVYPGWFPRFLEATQACQFSCTQCSVASFPATPAFKCLQQALFQCCVRPLRHIGKNRLDTPLWTSLMCLVPIWTKWGGSNLDYVAKCTYWIVCASISFPLFISAPCHFAVSPYHCSNPIPSKKEQHLIQTSIDSILVCSQLLTCTDLLASYPGQAQLSVACSTENVDFLFVRRESLGMRL